MAPPSQGFFWVWFGFFRLGVRSKFVLRIRLSPLAQRGCLRCPETVGLRTPFGFKEKNLRQLSQIGAQKGLFSTDQGLLSTTKGIRHVLQ